MSKKLQRVMDFSYFSQRETWLNEEIEGEVVPEGNFAMWWIATVVLGLRHQGGANVVMDLWSNCGKSTKK